MMAIETRAAPLQAERPDHQHQTPESTTLEPTPATCAGCESVESLYIIVGCFLCLNCVAITVSMAANDIWEGHVIYDKTFEDVLLS